MEMFSFENSNSTSKQDMVGSNSQNNSYDTFNLNNAGGSGEHFNALGTATSGKASDPIISQLESILKAQTESDMQNRGMDAAFGMSSEQAFVGQGAREGVAMGGNTGVF